MASKNASDGISIVQTAEGALQEVHSMLQRMNELAAQSATGTNQELDRAQLSREFNQLKREINDISQQTTFNGQRLLDGSLSLEGAYRGAQASGIYVAATEPEAVNSVSMINSNPNDAEFLIDYSKLSDGDIIRFAFEGETIATVKFDSATMGNAGEVINAIVSALDTSRFTASSVNDNITITSLTGDGAFSYSVDAGRLSEMYTLVSFDTSMLHDGDELRLGDASATWADGMTLADFIDQLQLDPSDYEIAGDMLKLKGIYEQDDFETAFYATPSPDGGGVHIQIGALKNEMLSTEIKSMNTRSLGLDGIDILTQEQAGTAVTATRDAIERVSAQRSLLGSMQNRLELKTSTLDCAAENLQEAEGKIRDTDIALEMTTYTKVGMLLQSSTEMIRQANELPRSILNLLQ